MISQLWKQKIQLKQNKIVYTFLNVSSILLSYVMQYKILEKKNTNTKKNLEKLDLFWSHQWPVNFLVNSTFYFLT